MKIPELKEELKKRGKPLLGKQGALVERLLSVSAKNIPVGNGKNTKPNKSDKSKSGGGMKWFPDTAYWRVLKPKNETVDEPNNATFKNPCAPTIPEEDAKYVPKKHDFDTHIKQQVFTGTYQQSITLIPISNGRCLQVIKMLYVLVHYNFNTHIYRPLLTGT